MKKFLFFLFLFAIFCSQGNSQSISFQTAPLTVEIGIVYDYVAVVTLPDGFTLDGFTWSATSLGTTGATGGGNVQGAQSSSTSGNVGTAHFKWGNSQFSNPGLSVVQAIAIVTDADDITSEVSTSIQVTVNAIVSSAAFSGSGNVPKCCPDNKTYTVVGYYSGSNSGFHFDWTLPAWTVIGGGGNSPSVTLQPVGTVGGTLKCKISRPGASSSYYVEVTLPLTRPDATITNLNIPTSLCIGSSYTFSVDDLSICNESSNGFNWSFPGSASDYTITNQGMSSITVVPNATATSGNVVLTVSFPCSGVTSSKIYPITVSAAPTGLVETGYNCNATLTWNAMPGATAYDVEHAPTATGPWSTIYPITGTSVSINDAYNVVNHWRVRANYPSCWGPYAVASFNRTFYNCVAPLASSLTASVSTNYAGLHWNSTFSGVDYVVDYKEDNATSWINISNNASNSTNLSVYGLNCNTTYDWRVRANCNCSVGSSAFTYSQFTTTNNTTCPLPSGLGVAAASFTSATVYWTDPAGALFNTLEVAPGPGYNVWETKGTNITNSNSYNITGLLCGTSYKYRVKSDCACLSSNYVTSAAFTTSSQTCNTPSYAYVQTYTPTTATVAWNTSSSNNTIEVAAGPSYSAWVPVVTNIGNPSSYTITGLQCSTSYKFRVTANCACGSSSLISSVFTTSTQSCSTPAYAYFQPSSITATTVTVSWSASASNIIEVAAGPSYSTWVPVVTNIGNPSSYTITGLQCSTSYKFRVTANCACMSSTPLVSTAFTTGTQSCGTPNYAYVQSSTITGTTARVSWSSPSSNNTIEVAVGPAYTTWVPVITNIGNPSGYTITGLTCNTSYKFRVIPVCACSSGTPLVSSAFTTSNPSCSAVTGAYSCGAGYSDGSLYWNPVPGAESYRVETSTNGITWIPKAVACPDNFFTLTLLASQVTYQWRVRANCECTTGSWTYGTLTTNFNSTMPMAPNDDSQLHNNFIRDTHKMALYPNPTSSEINLEWNMEEEELVEVTVMNVVGVAVHIEKFMGMEGFNRKTMFLTNVETGSYLVIFKSSEGISTKQLQIINN